MKNNINKLRTLFGFLMIISLSFISCHSLWDDLNAPETSFASKTDEVDFTEINLEKATDVSSADTSIASVEIGKDGKVIITSHAEGETEITIKNGSLVAKVKVTVNDKGEITLTVLEKAPDKGPEPFVSKTDEVVLKDLNLEKATDVSSADTSIASVKIDADGKVIITSLAQGETVLTIKNGSLVAKIKVVVDSKGGITQTVLEKAPELTLMTTEEFIAALGKKVETITCDATKGSGVVLSDDGKTANVYGVKLSGEFNNNTKFPITLIKADLNGLDISDITNLSCMFAYNMDLEELDLRSFDTSKVQFTSNMFQYCGDNNVSTGMKPLKIRIGKGWTLPKNRTFGNALDLLFIDDVIPMTVQEFIEALGTKVENITFDVTKAPGVTLSSDGKTAVVYNVKLSGDFDSNCHIPSTIKSADLSGLDISEVTKLTSMFENCSNLTNLDLSKLDTSKVTDMSKMFAECTALKELDLRGFDTSKVTNSTDMFLHDGTEASPLKIIYNEENWKLGTEATTGGATKLYFEKPLFEITVTKFNSIVSSVEEITYDTTKPFGIEISTDEKTANINGVKVIEDNVSNSLKFGRNLKKADLRGLVVSEITIMKEIFSSCEFLEELNISNWDTSKVTDMSYMFFRCYLLTKLDISSFDTSNVTTMASMFYNCKAVEEIKIDVNKFNTSKVTDMSYMFNSCSKLKNMDVSKFDTSNVNNINSMFAYCDQLQKLDVSNWNTSKVANMERLFSSCQVISELDVSKWDTSNVTNMVGIFDCCVNLESIDVSKWVTSNVTQMTILFYQCKKITSIDVSNFDTSKVTVMGSMFCGCENLESIDVSKFNTSSVTSMSMMFDGCGKITELDLSNFDTSKVTVMDRLFYNCASLETINLSSFDTSKLEKAEDDFIFAAVGSSTKSCDVIIGDNWTLHTPSNYTYRSSYDTQSCYLKFIKKMSVQNFITALGTDVEEIKPSPASDKENTVLVKLSSDGKTATVSGIKLTGKFTSSCHFPSSLCTADLTGLDTSEVTEMVSMFDGCESLETLDVSTFKTSNVTSMRKMFNGCTQLTELDLSSFDTSNVLWNSMGGQGTEIFTGCSSLETIYATEKFAPSNTNLGIFDGCEKLVGGAGTKYSECATSDSENYKKAKYAHIDDLSNPGYFTKKE